MEGDLDAFILWVNNAKDNAFMEGARDLELPIWPLERWQTFWRARAAWRCRALEAGDGRWFWRFEGPVCGGLCVALPARRGGVELSEVRAGDVSMPQRREFRFGRDTALVDLPEAADVELEARYGSPETGQT